MSTPHNDTPIKGQEYGKVISEKLSELILKYTSYGERIQIAEENNYSLSTVSKCIERKGVITPGNIVCMVELVKLAIQNCETNINHAKIAKKELKEIINQK